jgi:uncharacterized protein YecT (DUF1311 family)
VGNNVKCIIVIFFIIAAIAVQAAANAENTRHFRKFNSCMKNEKSLAQQSNCDAAELIVQKRKLTAAYNRIAKHIDSTELAALDKAQKDWITWRDSTYGYLEAHAGEVASTNYAITQGFLLNAIVEQTSLLNSVADSRGF